MSGLDGFSVMSRRKALKLALGAGGALLMGGGGLLALRGTAPTPSGLRILTGHEYRTMSKLAEIVVPSSGAVDLGRAFDGFLADEPPWNIRDLKSALFLLEFGPIVFERRLTTFSNLSPAERLAHFTAWSTSSLEVRRVAGAAFRRFLLLVFYDTPSSWPKIGYEGPLIRAPETP